MPSVWPEPMAGALRGPRGKPTALILLNGHSIKLYSEFVFLSMYVKAALRLHQRRFLV